LGCVRLQDDEMAGAVIAVDGVLTHCSSCQEQESRLRNHLVQKSRSAVETSGAVFGKNMQSEVFILFRVASWFIRSDCIGWSTAVSQRFTVNLCGDN